MYFEHVSHAGYECRDGGLKENNPIQMALNESRKIWEDPTFDVILSVGSGQAKFPQTEPSSFHSIPKWLRRLFSILVSTMNGEDAWTRFRDSQDMRIQERSARLNIKLEGTTEPEIDDTKAIPSMETAAKEYYFHEKPSTSPFSPTFGTVQVDAIQCLADRLRASLYFFELTSITRHGTVAVIHGWIGCRLLPSDKGFTELLGRTSHFMVRGNMYAAPKLPTDMPMRVEVKFQHQNPDEPIRIDANYGLTHYVTISGFPMTLNVGLQSNRRKTLVTDLSFFIDASCSTEG